MNEARTLLKLARDIASNSAEFQAVRGPGIGDKATGVFMKELRQRSRLAFGEDYSEKRLCGDNALAVDFYFPAQGAIVEVALGLPNPTTEFEKDILKAIMAQELGHRVTMLFFISRAGAIRKCSQPGRSAMVKWAHANHKLDIEVHELPGEPRKRVRLARGTKS